MSGHLQPIKLDSYKPLRELVCENIRQAIIDGTFSPGERLMEIQLADEMGVSRTPVREAIRKLELEGFVVMIPRRGTYVADISIKDITEIYEVRTSLDVLAAGLAAERITDEELDALERQVLRESEAEASEDTDEHTLDNIVYIDTTFHDIIYQAATNQRLVQFLNILQEQLQRFRAASLSRPGRSKTALEEHKQIIEALSERNGELASKLAKEHIDNAESAMIFAMQDGDK